MRDTWRTYQVPVPRDYYYDRAEGRQFVEKRADEITGYEYEELPPDIRAEVDADLAEMDAIAAACEVDAPYAWRDGECAVRRTDPPMAAE